MEEKGLEPSNRKKPVFCLKPDKKGNQNNEKDRMHELPMPDQVKKLVSGFRAQVVIGKDRGRIEDKVKVREHG